jgi:hypothetical protein
MSTITISEAALCLLRRRLASEWVEVNDETRPLYRELVDAGLMIPVHSFARGPSGAYRLTEAACDFRQGVNGQPNSSPST